MDQPSLLEQIGIVAVIGHKAGPHADHGLKAHVMELLVHGDRIGPELGVHVHLAHLGVIEPVNHHHISRQMTVTIALRNVQHLLLACVALFALDVPVSRLGQHVRGSGEQLVAGIYLVRSGACDHKERNPVAHLRGPAGLLVEAGLDGGL